MTFVEVNVGVMHWVGMLALGLGARESIMSMKEGCVCVWVCVCASEGCRIWVSESDTIKFPLKFFPCKAVAYTVFSKKILTGCTRHFSPFFMSAILKVNES